MGFIFCQPDLVIINKLRSVYLSLSIGDRPFWVYLANSMCIISMHYPRQTEGGYARRRMKTKELPPGESTGRLGLVTR